MDLERIREAAERVSRSLGMEVVDVEWKVGKQRFLRVFIDRPEGISHKDCEAVSNQFSVILDVEGLVSGPHYILEVSTPGLDRKLTKPAEFERFAGRLARILWRASARALTGAPEGVRDAATARIRMAFADHLVGGQVHLGRSAWIVAAWPKPSARMSCATALVGPSPITR